MDPITAPTIVFEAWKFGGVLCALFLLLVVVLAAVWKAQRSDNRRMAQALDSCQSKHVEIAATTATALANNTNAMNELCDVMRGRPCLKDPTPTRGSQVHFPTPRPPTEHRR